MRKMGLAALLILAAPFTAAQVVPPNVILIVVDDLGYGDLGIYGGLIAAPNIEGIARNGVRFTAGYVSAAVCSPSRAGILTGRNQSRFGYEYNYVGRYEQGLALPLEFGLPFDQPTLAAKLKAVGYATALFGKWHLGVHERHNPLERGFDEFYGLLGGGTSHYESAVDGARWWPASAVPRPREGVAWAIHDGKDAVEEHGYLTDVFAGKAVDFIERQAQHGGPFFLMLAPTAPHTPIQAPAEHVRGHTEVEGEGPRLYAAMVSAVDGAVGAVLAALERHSVDNTLVFFLSDNGCIDYAPDAICSNAPLRGAKRHHLEGGLRVPFLMQWRGTLPAGLVYDDPVSSLDIFPTAAAAAGLDAGTVDGVDLTPHLVGRTTAKPHEFLFWRSAPTAAVRWRNWKLLKVNRSDLPESALSDIKLLPSVPRGRASPLGQMTVLYDLDTDAGERRNLAHRLPAVVAYMEVRLQDWLAELEDPMWPSHRSTLHTLHGERVQLFF